MKYFLRIFILLFVFGILVTCEKENNPPAIQSTSASPQTVKTGEITQLTCVATDPDGDQLTYSWSAPDGSFPDGTIGSSVSWKAPDVAGNNRISIIVSDGKEVVDGAVNVKIEANPTLSVSPLSLEFGDTLTQLTLSIENSGTGNLPWYVSENLSWLAVSPQSGNTTSETDKVTATVNRAGLDPGNYNGTINVSSEGGSQEISVTLEVPQKGNIEGYVYYAGTTIPVPGVLVQLGDRSYSTDDTGFYTMEEIVVGSHTVNATKTNYDNYSRNITVLAGSNSYNIEMTSDRYTHNVYGNVNDNEGNPVSGVEVALLNSDGSKSTLITTTDTTGFYHLPSVPKGARIITFTLSYKNRNETTQAALFISDSDYPYSILLEKFFGEFTDSRDDNTYIWVKIGAQVWMAENLAYSVNGSWAYNNDESNVATYGRLYTWEAAKAACPSGWHLPSDAEWKQLEMAIGMSQSEANDIYFRGTNEGTKLNATHSWAIHGNGTDDCGFSALPGGTSYYDWEFDSMGGDGFWWSATEYDSNHAWFRRLYFSDTEIYRYNYKGKPF